MWRLILSSLVCGQGPIFKTGLEFKNGKLFGSLLVGKEHNVSMIVNLNFPDVVVPFAYADSDVGFCEDPRMCIDRSLPKYECTKVESSFNKSVLSPHIVGPAVIHSYETIGTIAGKSGVPLKITRETEDGILGLGPLRMSCRNETFLSKIKSEFFAFSLFHGAPELIVYTTSNSEPQRWTEQYQLGSTNSSAAFGKYAFNMFGPRICGVEVLAPSMSHLTTVIDTNQKCLLLPFNMYNSVKIWQSGSNNVLYFKLRDIGVENQIVVEINLNSVCVESHTKRAVVIGYEPFLAMLKTGTISFESVYPFRIDFGQDVQKIDNSCSIPKPTCIGDQIYNEPENECANPDCTKYMFFDLNTSTGTCEWRSYVPTMVYIAISILVLGELAVHLINLRINSLAQAACEHTE